MHIKMIFNDKFFIPHWVLCNFIFLDSTNVLEDWNWISTKPEYFLLKRSKSNAKRCSNLRELKRNHIIFNFGHHFWFDFDLILNLHCFHHYSAVCFFATRTRTKKFSTTKTTNQWINIKEIMVGTACNVEHTNIDKTTYKEKQKFFARRFGRKKKFVVYCFFSARAFFSARRLATFARTPTFLTAILFFLRAL